MYLSSRMNVVKQTAERLLSYCGLSFDDVHIVGGIFVTVSGKYAATFFRDGCY
jgi:hypothetical protein